MNFRGLVLGGLAVAAALSVSNRAMAQVAPIPVGSNCTIGNIQGNGGVLVGPGAGILGQMASATSAIIAANLSNATTAFQAQQGSAFVSAPGNPPPNSPGGGIWGRAIGGTVTTSSTSTTDTLNAGIPPLPQTTTVTCDNRVRDNYAGFQIGADTAKLNWNGWNLHLGTTAGYLESKSSSLNDDFRSTVQIPFVGTYFVATYGRFFADLMVRQEFYNISLTNAGLGFNGQAISGSGVSVAMNAGYNFALQNNWFIEPSAGFTWSKTSVDAFNAVGAPGTFAQDGANISATLKVDDITSQIGRASVRVGTTVQSGNVVLQPFASASVFHEFAGNITSTFQTCANCNFFGGSPGSFTANTSTGRIGTYGQYSVGVAAQMLNTGWLGFARVDYRNGENVEGWAGTGGLRYQFTPEQIAAIMPTKIPVKAVAARPAPVSWTGFYIGAHGGAGYGHDKIGFVDSAEDPAKTKIAGPLGGGQIGYNYQFAPNWVAGIEGDISWADIHGGKTSGAATGLDATGVPVGFSPFFMTSNSKLSWLASVTGKLGYAWERSLFYVKGGVGFTRENVTINCIIANEPGPGIRECRNQAGALVTSFGTAANRVGYTVGFGTEFAFNANWSAKGEYDYYNFGTRTALASDGTTTLTSRTDVHVTKVGVNYRFAPR